MVAVLTRIFGFSHAALVEDIVQDTFLAALRNWSFRRVPDRPSAWLMQVAKNRTINALKRQGRSVSLTPAGGQARKETAGQTKSGLADPDPEGLLDALFLEHEIRDSMLRMLFACSHPMLSEQARLVCTLRMLGGFGLAEIARALNMGESAVKKTLYRGRQLLRTERMGPPGVPFREEAVERAGTVLRFCYLLFNEGYKTTDAPDPIDEDLCLEAIRLAKLLVEELPERAGDCHALIALMCFTAARFPAREDGCGTLLDIREQDRSLWNCDLLKAGFHYMGLSRKEGVPGRFHIEAGIASVHSMARSWEETDWAAVLRYYELLAKLDDSDTVALNRAIATGYARGARKGLELLTEEKFRDRMNERADYHAALADVHMRLEDFESACNCYREALRQTRNAYNRRFLERKLSFIE